MAIIYYAATLASLVCWIMVLVKAFQANKIAVGVLGILCPLVALVWGWMNSPKIVPKNIMLIWTIAIVISMVTGYQAGLVTVNTGAPAGG